MSGLLDFIVRAKAATYVGSGEGAVSSRPRSHDLVYAEDGWEYRDSYFGGTDFIGEEVVWKVTTDTHEPAWAMNYYGKIIRDDLLNGATSGQIIKRALSAMYTEGRFLGGFRWDDGSGAVYLDESEGDERCFTGRESISVGGTVAYVLTYHGGLIRP